MKPTGKHIFLALMVLGLASAAAAEPRLNPTKMSCDSVQAAIEQHGAVTLRYMSTRVKNLPLYNRYVSNYRYCQPTEQAVQASVPSLDRPQCPVYVCQDRSLDEGGLFILPGR